MNQPASDGTAIAVRWAIRIPTLLLDFFFLLFFLMAVGHAFLHTREFGPIFVCLFPPAVCYLYVHSPITRTSTKLVTALFLAMISLGDVMAYALPQFGKDPLPGTSPHESAVLSWYIGSYLLFVVVILPPVLFVRPLIARYQKRIAEFSIITCFLGLLLWIIMAPFVISIMIRFLIEGPLPNAN